MFRVRHFPGVPMRTHLPRLRHQHKSETSIIYLHAHRSRNFIITPQTHLELIVGAAVEDIEQLDLENECGPACVRVWVRARMSVIYLSNNIRVSQHIVGNFRGFQKRSETIGYPGWGKISNATPRKRAQAPVYTVFTHREINRPHVCTFARTLQVCAAHRRLCMNGTRPWLNTTHAHMHGHTPGILGGAPESP